MESNFKNVVIFIISFCVIFLFLLLIISSNKTNKINEELVKKSRDDYPIYNIDDEVKLIDDSEWYVLKNNNSTDKEIYLISKYKNNEEVIDNISKYVNDIYLDDLCRRLSISRKQISDIRLLNLADINELFNNESNINFDTSKYKLLSNATLVDYYLDNIRLSLCNEGFCKNDNTDIRIVIKIPKFFIKKED